MSWETILPAFVTGILRWMGALHVESTKTKDVAKLPSSTTISTSLGATFTKAEKIEAMLKEVGTLRHYLSDNNLDGIRKQCEHIELLTARGELSITMLLDTVNSESPERYLAEEWTAFRLTIVKFRTLDQFDNLLDKMHKYEAVARLQPMTELIHTNFSTYLRSLTR